MKAKAGAEMARLGVSRFPASAGAARLVDTAGQSTESGVQVDSSVACLVRAMTNALTKGYGESSVVDVCREWATFDAPADRLLTVSV